MTDDTDDPTRRGRRAGPSSCCAIRPTRDRIAALLPPGLEPLGEPIVQIGIYCVPVHGEPEYGVSTKVPARFDGIDGQYCLGIGIDQESAIFISRETNGQPKFPCSVRFFRLGDEVARPLHPPGPHVPRPIAGTVSGTVDPDGRRGRPTTSGGSRCRGPSAGVEQAYDFPPHVVRVHTAGVRDPRRDARRRPACSATAPWDPYTELLPDARAGDRRAGDRPATPAREITLAGPLDPDAFWPHADTIGGSRWPGERGAPRSPSGSNV